MRGDWPSTKKDEEDDGLASFPSISWVISPSAFIFLHSIEGDKTKDDKPLKK
jgi:hypothetical protein